MQFRRIVIGVDFTEASLAAARWAALQFAPRAQVVLVHALPHPQVPSFLQPHLPDPAELSASLAPVLSGGLRGLASLIGAERTRIHLAAGQPADVLARAAHAYQADLVCVGRGARRRGSARFGATTAQRLLARTRVATVVVPAGRHDAPARALVALDDRPGSEHLLHVARDLAAAFEARVDVLHVLSDEVCKLAEATQDLPRARVPGETPVAPHGPWLRARAVAWLRDTLDRAGLSSARTEPVVAIGDAGEELVAHLERRGTDLVVVGRGGDASRAQVPLGALSVGSTTRLAIWAASCPVLVLSLDARPVGRPVGDRRTRRLRRARSVTPRAASSGDDAHSPSTAEPRARGSADARPPVAPGQVRQMRRVAP